MNNFSLKVYLRVSKSNKKEEAPIYIRVIGNGQSSDVCSGIYINKENWNSAKSVIKGSKEDVEIKRERLKTKLNKINKLLLDFERKDEPFTPKIVTDKLREKNGQVKKTLLVISKLYLDYKKAGLANTINQKASNQSNDGFSLATIKKVNNFYVKAQNYFKASTKYHDIYIANIDTAFIEDFKMYCVDLGNSANTIVKEVKVLKAVLHWAKERKLIQMPTFRAKTTYKETHIKYLNALELENLLSVKTLTETEEKIWDLFLFGCYTTITAEDLNR
jgi:hypothetical protein